MMDYVDQGLLGTGLALGLGMLIGMEREWAASRLGVRTFTLLSGAGAAAVVLAGQFGNLVVPVALLAAALLLATVLRRSHYQQGPTGATTAIAALVTFMIGVMAGAGLWLEALVLAAATMLLLHWKQPLHRWIEQIGPGDFEIIARFTLIALLVLPILPDRAFGPYAVFNPFRSWLIVVLIVGINMVGYLMFRFSPKSSGLWLAGVVGGLISSTATTVSYSTISKRHKNFGPGAALVILVASALVYGRVLFELFLVAPALLSDTVGPMLLMTVVLLTLAALVSWRVRRHQVALPEQKNPAQFGLALSVAVVYVVILFAVAITKDLIGGKALYALAAISGLTDVDALTLSVAQHFDEGKLAAETSWRAIFLATLSNMVFKTGVAAVLGAGDLRRYMLATGSAAVFAGAGILLVWP
jgi:uncharacterized membrane protein (DUF4010 family)